MYPLLETIRFEKREFYNLEAHQERVNRAFQEFWPKEHPIQLKDCLNIINEVNIKYRYKYRIVYDTQVKEVTVTPYRIRPIHSLQVIEAPELRYAHKKEDRNALKALFDQRGNCDDVLITQNGYLTDTYYCNLACWNGTQWLTPAKPLLPGTQRAKLIKEGSIVPRQIHQNDLIHFEKIMLFNAMIDPGELVLDTQQIKSID
ncbi:MAG TPA: 4-amino-4-deoxychorismate lyase [Microscillaceae bacterium]|nr:4-amino-4-deoxychorismate lyase [Microscillaceae bacterium]